MSSTGRVLSLFAVFLTLLLAQAAFAAPYEGWAGMYLGKEKMGYAYLKVEDVPGGYGITEEMDAALTVLGTVQEVKINTSSITDGGYRVKNFRFSMALRFCELPDRRGRGWRCPPAENRPRPIRFGRDKA